MCGCVKIYAHECRFPQKPGETVGPCRGGVMGSCEPPVWVLRDKLQASAGAICRLNHSVIFAGLCLALYMVFPGSNLGPHAYRGNI